MRETVGIIGLGVIGGHHARALSATPGVEVVGGADIEPGRMLTAGGEPKPVYASVSELLDINPSAVIIATPTATHHDVCKQILAHRDPPRRVIVEKPLASSLEQVKEMLAARAGVVVEGVYHAAHAPEVVWAMEHWAAWRREYGEVIAYESVFTDPYANKGDRARGTYINSWLDSGINALSVAYRFIALTETERCTALDERGSVFEAVVRFRRKGTDGMGVIRTSWDVTAPAKHSEFRFESGVVLHLDHQAIRGTARRADETLDAFEYRGDVPRLQLHYLNAFKSLFTDHAAYYTAGQSLLLHRLLLGSRVLE